MKKMASFLILLLALNAHAVKINGPLEGALLESKASDPAAKTGRVYFNTTEAKAKLHNGTAWTDIGSGSGGSSFGVLTNGGFESGTSGWTASGGAYDVQSTHVTANSLFGASWDSSGAGQTLCSDAITVSSGVGLSLQNIEGSAYFKCASGTCTHKIQVRDGSTVLHEDTIASFTDRFFKRGVTVGAPASGSLTLCAVSVAADEPILYVDDAYLGAATNLGIVNPVTDMGSVSWTPTWSKVGGTAPTLGNGTISGKGQRFGDRLDAQITLQAGSTSTFGDSSGTYTFTLPYPIDASKEVGNGSTDDIWLGHFRVLRSGVTRYSGVVIYVNETTVKLVRYAVDSTAATSTTAIQSNSSVNATEPQSHGSGDIFALDFKYHPQGWTSKTAIAQDDPVLPTVQIFTSGSGTYTKPAKVTWIRVRMVGGGGGGSGSGTSAGAAAGSGGNSTFGSLLAGGGLGGGQPNGAYGGAGGGTTANATGIGLTGGQGGPAGNINSTPGGTGGSGGNSAFGGGGSGGGSTNPTAGQPGYANTGGGGGGGNGVSAGVFAGAGGGSGGFVDAIINNPSASYAYAVGAGGTAGAAGPSGVAGGAGGSGIVVVEEFYGAMSAPLLVDPTEVNASYALSSVSHSAGENVLPFVAGSRKYSTHDMLTSTGVFTIPVAGRYRFTCATSFASVPSGLAFFYLMVKRGSTGIKAERFDTNNPASSQNMSLSVSGSAQFAVGETLSCYFYSGAVGSAIASDAYNYFDFERVGNY